MLLEEFEKIYRENYGMVIRCAYLNIPASQAEDVAQDAFMSLLRRGKDLEEIENINNWLFRVTKNVCCDYYRRKKDIVPMEYAEPYMGEQPAIQENVALINEILKKLRDENPLLHDVIYRHCMAGEPIADTANALGYSICNIYRLIKKARKFLQKEYGEAEPVF